MSPAWVVAALLLALLVACLTVVVVRLLTVISSIEVSLTRVHRELAALRQPATGMSFSALPVPASVLVTLEPDLDATRSLALDITAMGGLGVGLPARVLVPDTPEGRALAETLPLPVELEHRSGPVPDGFPSVVVLDASGAVLTKGSPASVADVQALVAAV
jgi:hypothetical protein